MSLRAHHEWYSIAGEIQCRHCGLKVDNLEQAADAAPLCYFPEHSIQELQTLSRMPSLIEAKAAYDEWMKDAKRYIDKANR